MKLVAALDRWWQSRTRRLDRAPANLALTIGLMCPTVSIVLRGPSPVSFVANMDSVTQIAMCACVFIGLAICLHGMCMQSRWYFPRARLIDCYRKAMYGGPLVIAGLAVYTYYLAAGTTDVWGTLNIFLTPALAGGVLGQMFLYWLDIRRIRGNAATFAESAKLRARITDELSDDS